MRRHPQYSGISAGPVAGLFCKWTRLISLLNNSSKLRRNRTYYWIAWEKSSRLVSFSPFSVILKEGKMFNKNERLSGQQLWNINIVPCISGAEFTRCEQKVTGWCNIKMSGFLYLQGGIFPFWLYTLLPGGVSVTPVTWRCPAPPAVRLESSRYLLLYASLRLDFRLFE